MVNADNATEAREKAEYEVPGVKPVGVRHDFKVEILSVEEVTLNQDRDVEYGEDDDDEDTDEDETSPDPATDPPIFHSELIP